jgi:hypothetical protein
MIDANKLIQKINDIEEPKGLLGPFVHAAKVWAEALVMAEEVVDWIPVPSDKKPDDGERVLVTVIDMFGKERIRESYYDKAFNRFLYKNDESLYVDNSNEVIGWMPAPEPMKRRNR